MTTSFQSCAAGFMTPELAATPACATKDIAVVPESSQAAGACSASAGSASPAAKLHFCKEGRDMARKIRGQGGGGSTATFVPGDKVARAAAEHGEM